LLVCGMTPEILFGSGNVTDYGFRPDSSSSRGDDEYAGVYHLLTVHGGGLYYDTASDELLEGLTEDSRAQDELDKRESEDWAYSSAEMHTVTSSKFTITCTGRISNSDVSRTIKTVVRRTGSIRSPRIDILEWHDNYTESAYLQFGGEF